MSEYPVLDVLQDLQRALRDHPIVILKAPPGAGKSTILPLHFINNDWLATKKIIMLEPRRLAARSVAERMAATLEEAVGQRVGYRIRFENKISAHTRIEVVTEGILTRMIQTDPTLSEVGMLIFDEFHERSLQADLSLALSIDIQKIVRDDLRILIMSATLASEGLAQTLGNAPVIISEGRKFPVAIHYATYQDDANEPTWVATARVIRKAFKEQPGDLLVFLPGVFEIKKTHELLDKVPLDAIITPLYGDLPFVKQQEAIMPNKSGMRKIVLATSIAETSLTIEGVTTVIDAGFARVPKFNPRSGLTRLETVRVTRDAADQRAGRAGRLGPGVCYRLWTSAVNTALLPQRTPEILEADLASCVLELAKWGTHEMHSLTWITSPPAGNVLQAKELLHQLDALDKDTITTKGIAMAALPTHPRFAHMMMEAKAIDQLPLAADLVATLEERDALAKESGADISLRIQALRKWRERSYVQASTQVLERVEKLSRSWRQLFSVREDNTIVADETIGLLIAAAYPERIAQQVEPHSEKYKLANGRFAKLPAHDPLTREKWLAVAFLDAGKGEGKIFMAAAVREKDLYAIAVEREVVQWDNDRGMLVGSREACVGNLVLQRKVLTTISEDIRKHVLCNTIREKGLTMIGWTDMHTEWRYRIMSLQTWCPDETWPDVTEKNLLNILEEWLWPFINTANKASDLQRLDLKMILTTLVPWHLQAMMDELAPSKIQVPSGSMINLIYDGFGSDPTLEVRLQEVFGWHETPRVNNGKVKIKMHLLSPGYKPVQVTQDLRSFWTTTYAAVRKQLRARYPRHHWPEEPLSAQAVRGVQRKPKQ